MRELFVGQADGCLGLMVVVWRRFFVFSFVARSARKVVDDVCRCPLP